MQANTAFQDAVARAREIAQKLTASAPNSHSLKRPNSEDDSANKRPALASPADTNGVIDPVLRAQQIAQRINSQLGVKPMLDPLTNQLTCQEDYRIPDRFVGLVIGKGGEQIIRIQADSGCRVVIGHARGELAEGPSSSDRIANLSGTRDAIERAKRIMEEIVTKGRMAQGDPITLNPYTLGGNSCTTVDVMLPSAKCGLIIGKGGETIRRVSDEYGVKLYVAPETTDIDGIEHKPLKIMGEAEGVERAKQHVLEILSRSSSLPPSARNNSNATNSSINDYGSRVTGSAPITGPCNEATYHVAYEKAGLVIGKGGETIKEINRKSGAFVEVDKTYVSAHPNASERVFKLRGTPEQIATAQQLMYDRVASGSAGPGDSVTPAQFQQLFNLPSITPTATDPWNAAADPYSNGMNSSDPYSQWANYSQWAQLNPYADGAAKADPTADAAAMAQMDPAWVAYYQSMSYYNMMQSTPATTKSTDATANATENNTSTAAVNSATGQADYSKQWIEYYRSVGQNDLADQIVQQMKDSSSTSSSTVNPWAAYAQQWAAAAATAQSTTSNSTNGTNSSTAATS